MRKLVAGLLVGAGAVTLYGVASLAKTDTLREAMCKVYTIAEDYTPDTLLGDVPLDTMTEWMLLDYFNAICYVESAGDDRAYNDKEDAVGCAQIRPCMVDEANRIAGFTKYSLEDRWNHDKSYEIFKDVVTARTSLDLDEVISLWNPNCTSDYREAVWDYYLGNGEDGGEVWYD